MKIIKTSACIFFIYLFIPIFSYCQNGTYKCSSQAYTTTDKSKNKTYANNQIITVNIHDVFGGDIILNELSENFILKYNILPNDKKTYTDKDDRTIIHTYFAKLVVSNIEMEERFLVGLVQSMDNNSLNLWIFSEKHNSYNHYFNLVKL
ncbi:MAG: hypothetical protein B7X86_14460 [Sphingobacteriales bacterium 17-39-43]|uniref:hypothetical protein n=1 Tax=Daejeonella sp. TaxID=2805397 RepID=UPI000BCB0073|nr:hypothetical protein [Daejeonella sp.]OYZ30150.1 MAG: hypothetical protein B7Y24_14225 [Sphingobacteriales bacterium 16-39-50]OZA22868.1 MAG: hypothetical protein B7X86_14460 [Sphingobacteriales bacterium 17-39-43]HQT23981.1 hypothetical protein [Daejeonella sp.]HQT58645.1 hypothetical protein [Daejeonella sp.]